MCKQILSGVISFKPALFCFFAFILITNSSILVTQNIISIQDGDWSEPGTWNLGRIPIPADWILIGGNTIVWLDDGLGWCSNFNTIEIDGMLCPRIRQDFLPGYLLEANQIQVNEGGQLLGYDIDNLNNPDIPSTGVSSFIFLDANTINNFGNIEGGNNFRDYWSGEWWDAAPTFINIQAFNFNNAGTITAGSGVMGENISTMGGFIFFFIDGNFTNTGIIQTGDGYWEGIPFDPNSIGEGGSVYLEIGNINLDEGQIIGGQDMGPPEQLDATFTNHLWIASQSAISCSGPDTSIDQFGLIEFRSYFFNPMFPITVLFLTDLDPNAVYARKNYVCNSTTDPANGGKIVIDYIWSNSIDMRGNQTNVLLSEQEDWEGEPALIQFSQIEADANILLDPEVNINDLCDPDPTFMDSREFSDICLGDLYPGFTDISEMSEPYLVPGLGFPGEMAHIPIRFVNLGERYDFHIEISDELGYSFYPHNVWIYSYDDPDTTFTIDVQIPYSAPIGTTNNFQITSSTYPQGEYPDIINWKVVVVPPVKVYPEGDFYTEPGQTDTITVTVYNHSDDPANFNVYSYTEDWSVWPYSQNLYIYGHESGNVDFYIQIPNERNENSNWFSFKAESDSPPYYWDMDTTYVYLEMPEPPENVMIEIVDDIITITWDEVLGCTYSVYSSPDPYEPIESWFNEAAGILETFWSEFANEKKFYYVTAVK